MTGELDELIKHGLRALRDTLPSEVELTTKVQVSAFRVLHAKCVCARQKTEIVPISVGCRPSCVHDLVVALVCYVVAELFAGNRWQGR